MPEQREKTRKKLFGRKTSPGVCIPLQEYRTSAEVRQSGGDFKKTQH